MSKPFQTHNTQLKILRNRNIIIKNGSKAKGILIRENYYQIINGYKHIFLDIIETKKRKDDYYKDGTTFEQIYALYEFDRNLRNLLLKYLLMTENSIRSKIAYQFSSEHRKEPFAYFNINNYQSNNHQNTTALIAELSSVTKNNTDSLTRSGPFYHYFAEHQDLPLWVLITKLSFGQTVKLFYNLTHKMKTDIIDCVFNEFKHNCSKSVPVKKLTSKNYLKEFDFMLNCVKSFRNVCAHEDRLYDYKAVNKNGKAIVTSFFFLNQAPAFNGGFYDILIILRFFLTAKDYKQLFHKVKSELSTLSETLPSNLFSEVLRKMRLPKDWESKLLSLK